MNNSLYYTVYFNGFLANKQMNSKNAIKCHFEKLDEALDHASEYVGEKVSINSIMAINGNKWYSLSSPSLIGNLEIRYEKTLNLYPNLDIE